MPSTNKKQILDSDLARLVSCAREARGRAYAPYSHYAVGAAAMGKSGKIFMGCNVENAAFPSGLCAERVAIFKAVSEGEREIIALAVVTANHGSPCGACRQVLSEFARDNAVIVLAATRGSKWKRFTMQEILPDRFGRQDLLSV